MPRVYVLMHLAGQSRLEGKSMRAHKTHELIFAMVPFPYGTNNIGEFLAIVKALSWVEENRNRM
jgi:ribonuclease HI